MIGGKFLLINIKISRIKNDNVVNKENTCYTKSHIHIFKGKIINDFLARYDSTVESYVQKDYLKSINGELSLQIFSTRAVSSQLR